MRPVFIVGAPRTGSTIFYQALTELYEINYIDNTASFWHKNMLLGMCISKLRYGDRGHGNFDSELGDTSRYGAHSPSECGAFWYNWLPREKHFISADELSDKSKKEMKTTIHGLLEFFGKSFVFKNLNAGQRLKLINELFPEAYVIFVRRDPRFVLRSLLKARKKMGVNAGEWWSVKPENYSELLCLPEINMCAAQMYYIEKQIEDDLCLFPKSQVREIHYQNFDEELVKDVAVWLGLSSRSEAIFPGFKKDCLENLARDERKSLQDAIAAYPFNSEVFI